MKQCFKPLNVFKYILFLPSKSFQRLSLRCIKSALLHGCGKNDQACHLNIIIEHQLEWKATANRRNFPIGVFQLVMAVKATTSWSVADLINFSLPDFYSLTKIKEVRRVKSDIFLDIVGFNRIVQQMMQNWIIVIKIKKFRGMIFFIFCEKKKLLLSALSKKSKRST